MPKKKTKQVNVYQVLPVYRSVTQTACCEFYNHGPDFIFWADLKTYFGKDYKKFAKWMDGQTCIEQGAYPYDVERYINGYANND